NPSVSGDVPAHLVVRGEKPALAVRFVADRVPVFSRLNASVARPEVNSLAVRAVFEPRLFHGAVARSADQLESYPIVIPIPVVVLCRKIAVDAVADAVA